ncbi:MAG: hypothetical protein Q8M17_10100 [Actinomycetota bacterium]|nr:hypothetical protein [Actinomycetota bacterium]
MKPPRASLPRWLPPALGAAVFLAVLISGALVTADWVKRGTEMRALVAQIEVSEAAMGQAQDAVREAFAPYEGTGALTEADRQALDAALSAVARDGLAGVTRGGDLVASVAALPWHRDIEAARAAYLAHNRAWQGYLSAAAEDPAEFAVTHDDVNSTWESAEPVVRGAVPQPDLFGLGERVDAIFADEPATAAEGQVSFRQ